MDVQPGGKSGVAPECLAPAKGGHRLDVGQRDVVERLRGSAGHRPRHVGHAVMDHAFVDVYGIVVGGWPAGFETAALVDGDIDDRGAVLHGPDHVPGQQLWCGSAGNQHRADDQIGSQSFTEQVVAGCHQHPRPAPELCAEFAQAGNGLVEYGHVRLQADRHGGRVGAGNAAPDDHHPGRRDPRHAAEQHATPAVRILQRERTHLNRHASGHLAHGREQRQPAAGGGHRLVGDGRCPGLHQGEGLRLVGSEMQIGEQHLFRAQPLAFVQQRLLHLDHQVGGEGFLNRPDARSGTAVVVIGKPGTDTGARLHDRIGAGRGEFRNRFGRQADPVLVDFDFPWDPDSHGCLFRGNSGRSLYPSRHRKLLLSCVY